MSSVGKSTLAIQILASYIKQLSESDNYIVLYFDTEESITKSRINSLGILDESKILILQPDYIENIYDIITKVKTKRPNYEIFAIWDTLMQTPSKERTEDSQKIASHARSTTELFNKLKFKSNKLTMLSLDQHREVIATQTWKKNVIEPTTCNAVKHKSFLTLNASSKKSEFFDADVGRTVTFTTYKSKVSSPKKKFELEFLHTTGYDSVLSLINYMRREKIIGKKGGGYYYFEKDKQTGWRLNDFYKYLITDDAVDVWKDVILDIYEKLYPYDNKKAKTEAKDRIFNYYFKDNKIQLDRFTSLSSIFMDADEVVDNDQSNDLDYLDEQLDSIE